MRSQRATETRWLACRVSLLGHLYVGSAGDYVRHGFGLRVDEAEREIASEERIVFRTSEGFLRVVRMIGSGTVESDESGGEIHLRVVAAKLDGFFHESEAIEALRRIGSAFVDPMELVQSFGVVAEVEGSERGLRGIVGGIGASEELEEEMLRGVVIVLGVERGAAKSFHVDEDGGIGIEYGDGVSGEILDVVGFAAGEIPAVADPGERFGVADIEWMADERGTGEGGAGEKKSCEKKSDGEMAEGKEI